ncbi:MAG TPA: AAA family ATPase [Candidatus Limnocylindria bacterium]|nr:AAA family ATPase [Candidatus Limnocylindria bacterium]
MRQLYLAATGMNRGKTTVALGLLAALIDRGVDTGFIKPVGQRYAVVDGQPADEDAILMRSALGLRDPLGAMSPVTIPRGFTKAHIMGKAQQDLAAQIRRAHRQVGHRREAVLVEGTGHAGVGSVIGMSNAQVARMLGAPALIVSEAGVGRPIDEIVLNHALFERHGVEVVGAIVNKVDADAHPSLPEVLREGLARHGIELLGMLPYRPLLSNPTLSMLVEQIQGEVLSRAPDMGRVIEHVAIGAMQPRHLVERVGPGSLLIVPGDRTDVIHATLAANRAAREQGERRGLFRVGRRPAFGRAPIDPRRTELVGMVLTGGYRPRPRDLDAIRGAGMFAYLVEDDTYAVASAVHDLLVKLHPADTEKIELTKRLVAEHLDVERIYGCFAEPRRRGEQPDGVHPPPAGQFVSRVGWRLRRLGRRAARCQ